MTAATLPNFMAQHGARLTAAGYHILPIQPGRKSPGVFVQGEWRVVGGWQRHCDVATADAELDTWAEWPECAVGIACGYTVGIDIDLVDGALSLQIDALAREMLGDTPLVRIGLPPKRLLVYRADVPFPKRSRKPIEVLARGSQFVARSIHPDTGQPYTWPEGQPEETEWSALPLVTEARALAFLDAAYDMVPAALRPHSVIGTAPAGPKQANDARGTRAAVESALRSLPNNDMDRDSWVKIGLAIKGALGDAGRDIWLDWSRSSSKSGKSGRGDTAERKWHGFMPASIGAGTLYYLAGKEGWTPPAGLILNAAAAEAAETEEHPAAALLAEVRARRERGHDSQEPGISRQSAPLPALSVIDPTQWEGVPVPVREWAVHEWLPIGHTTLMYADGGVGKSLLTLQLMAASSLGAPWLQIETLHCRSVGLFAEDEPDELQRRLAAIAEHYGASFAHLGNMRLMSGVGRANLLAKIGKDGSISTTDRWDELRGVALEHGARLVAVDTAATSFAGNENDRAAVTQFVGGVLTGLAQEIGGAVVLNAHPSRSGLAEGGTLDGGSTGWRASARSVLSLEVPKGEDKLPIRSQRLLTRRKANYAPDGEALRLEWCGGVLAFKERTMSDVLADASRGARCLSHVVAELGDIYRTGGHVARSGTGGHGMASQLSGLGKMGGYTKREIGAAVAAGLKSGEIELYTAGRAGAKIRPRHAHGAP